MRRELEAARGSAATPLIKKPKNMLRIRLLKALYPNSRFVLIVRHHRNYVPAIMAKKRARRDAGLHWYLTNSVAWRDLHAVARGDHVLASLETLLAGPGSARAELDRVTRTLGMPHYGYDVSGVNGEMAHQCRDEPEDIGSWIPLNDLRFSEEQPLERGDGKSDGKQAPKISSC
jgi:hypothetical protein